jgi:hydrogenase maturation protease
VTSRATSSRSRPPTTSGVGASHTGHGPGAAPAVDLKVRCLQLQDRAVEEASGDAFRLVEFLDVGGELQVSWDEGVERELEVSGVPLLDLARDGERVIPLELPGGSEVEELRSPAGEVAGRLVRRRWPVSGVVRLSAERARGEGGAPELLRLRVRIENRTPWPPEPAGPADRPLDRPLEREDALRRSLVGAHTLLAVAAGSGAGFVSLLDPPPAAAGVAAGCANLHTWPVLAGPEGSRDVLLSSPIIFYDHPAIAPESPGDLCDATEIDEILTLLIMTLTEEEKREARMSRGILVAGVGNIFLGDDGFGVEVVRRLQSRPLLAGVRVADFGIRGVHLAFELLERPEDTTVLVDLTPRGGEPGTIYLIEPDLETLGASATGPADAHSMTPEAVFGLLRSLGGTPRRVLIVGCEPLSTEEEMGLSPPVEGAVDEAVAMILAVLERETAASGDPAGALQEGGA